MQPYADHICPECNKELTPVYEERFDIDRQVMVWNNNPHNDPRISPGNQITSWAAYGDFLWYKRHDCPPRNSWWEKIDYMMEYFASYDQQTYVRWDGRIWDELRDKTPISQLQSIYLGMYMDYQPIAQI